MTRRATSLCWQALACGLTLSLATVAAAAAPASAAHAAPIQPIVADGKDPLAVLIAMERRVAPIIRRLAVGNAAWCPAVMPTTGWLLGDRRLYRDVFWPRVRTAYAASDADAPFVAALDPASPAARAGLREGDAIAAINGMAIAAQSDSPHARLAAAHAILAALPPDQPISLTVLPAAKTIIVQPERGCASEFRVEASDAVRARADGTLVLISAGMVRFADSDDELATVIAHELAHNILRHRERLNDAAIKRGVAQFFGRNARLTRITESEADRLAVWLLDGAGFDTSAAARFWTNFGKRGGGGLFAAPTHPKWRTRVAEVTKEIETMRLLRASNPAAPPPLIANPTPLD